MLSLLQFSFLYSRKYFFNNAVTVPEQMNSTTQFFCYLMHHSLNKLQPQSQEMVEASAPLFVFCGRVNWHVKTAGLKKVKVQHKLIIYTPESFKARSISRVVILCRSRSNWSVSRRGGSADKIETQTKN